MCSWGEKNSGNFQMYAVLAERHTVFSSNPKEGKLIVDLAGANIEEDAAWNSFSELCKEQGMHTTEIHL